jgi:hypothetical protein
MFVASTTLRPEQASLGCGGPETDDPEPGIIDEMPDVAVAVDVDAEGRARRRQQRDPSR